jgi:hypothetical protein
MGLKSGSRDAGLDESDEDDGESQELDASEGTTETETIDPFDEQNRPDKSDSAIDTDSGPDTAESDNRPSMSSIPYKLRRDKVNQGREQVPFFLREEVIDAEDELQNSLENMLGEDVYKSDYREAAMVLAQRQPELVAEVLREWGYDLET